MTGSVALVTCGPPEHGIARFGRELTAAARAQGFRGTVIFEADPGRLLEVVGRLPGHIRLVHLQVNDWLFTGPDIDAGERIAEFSSALRRQGRTLTVTLHDLPQPGVTEELFRRRARSYCTIVRQSQAVVVASDHERDLLAEAAISLQDPILDRQGARPGRPVEVIPLPVGSNGHRARTPAVRPIPTVGIFGFIYPGKGHQDVLRELGAINRPVAVRAIGRPSDGHESMLHALGSIAAENGVSFDCTGYLADRDVDRELRSVAVPVAPHPQVSASGSINSWIAAGRRPLVLAGRYTRELDRRMPGAVALYEPGRLGEHVKRALNDPRLTVIADETPVGPSLREVAAHYLRWLSQQVEDLE